jgi:hypothetical protein
MTLALSNELGKGLYLKLVIMGGRTPKPTPGKDWKVDYQKEGPDKDKGPTIHYGDKGQPPSPPSKDDDPASWTVWNVYDEETYPNYYGTITVRLEGGQWILPPDGYKPPDKNKDYSLVGVALNGKNNQYQLKCTKVNWPGPPIITNLWWSGQRNDREKPTVGKSFWVRDYGEKELWSRALPDAIQQSTAGTPNPKPPPKKYFGSRAYPIHIDTDDWRTVSGSKYGVAKYGLWQIAIQIGSDGRPYSVKNGEKIGWCETFYLAERLPPLKGDPHDLHWGPDYYSDGQGGIPGGTKQDQEKALSTKKVSVWKDRNPKEYGKLVEGRGAYSREIDIMETMWTPEGPQFNLGNMGGGTAWNVDAKKAYYGLDPKQIPLWSQVARAGGGKGAPTKDFIIFGCLILPRWGKDQKDTLWLYAYNTRTAPGAESPRNGQWYCTQPIPKKPDKDPRTGKDYEQIGPFVPYIGTWTNGDKDGNFPTKYNHFIYLRPDDPQIAGRNPLNNCNYFGWWNPITHDHLHSVDYK